jgi:hypothetical protein
MGSGPFFLFLFASPGPVDISLKPVTTLDHFIFIFLSSLLACCLLEENVKGQHYLTDLYLPGTGRQAGRQVR